MSVCEICSVENVMVCNNCRPDLIKIKSPWISTSERLPEEGQIVDIIVFDNKGKTSRVCDCTFKHYGNTIRWMFFKTSHIYGDKCTTHWMPLPPPPQ